MFLEQQETDAGEVLQLINEILKIKFSQTMKHILCRGGIAIGL